MTRYTAVLLVLALPAACGGGAPDTPEEAARVAFVALESGDFEACEPILPNEDDYDQALEGLERNFGEEAAERRRRETSERGGVDRVIGKTIDKWRERFRREREEAAGDFDWSSAEFAGVDEERSSLRTKRGTEMGNIAFRVRAGGRVYRFLLRECIKSDRGWISGEGIRYCGPE